MLWPEIFAFLPRAIGSRERPLAAAVHPHLSRTRSLRAGDPPRGDDDAAVLDHARPLPRGDLERRRARPRLWRLREDCPQLPRHPLLDLHGQPAGALARERGQAAGEVPEDLPRRQRHSPHPPRARVAREPPRPSESGSFLGRLRHRRGRGAPRRPSRRVLLLEAAQRRRADRQNGVERAPGRSHPAAIRVQVRPADARVRVFPDSDSRE